jgi:DNA topoisomerase-3
VKKSVSNKEETLPLLNENDIVDITKIGLDKKNTKPPVRLNDSSLLKLMKTAGKEVDDKDLAKAMKENGIGTSATRAGIIEKLITIDYLNRDKKNLVPSKKGMERIASEIDDLKSPSLTGQWEQKLQMVEKGEYSAADFDKEIVEFIKNTLPGVSQSKKLTVESFGQCPVCGKGEVIEGSKGFGCSQYPDCGFVVWKSICGKAISADQVRQLIEAGKTSILEGFTNQEGKSFNAALIIKDGVVKFEYEKINCPVCKAGNVFESIKGFGCSKWKDGCKFFIFKTVAGKKLTPAQTKQLIEKGKTGLIKGFMSKKKKPFDAYLVLKEGKPEFEFQEKKKPVKKKENSRGGKK